MIVINNVDSQKFSFNGVEYFKNFTPVVVGNKIRVLNTYDSSIELTDAPRLYSEFEVDGVVYASVSLLQTALLPILYTRNTLGGGGAVDSVNGQTGTVVLDAEDVLALSNDISTYTPATTPLVGTEKALIHDGIDFKEVAVSEFGISGTGTTNRIAKFTASGVVGDSQIFDNGTNVGINTITPSANNILEVNGMTFISAGTDGNTTAPLIVRNTIQYSGSFQQFLQLWQNSVGSNIMSLRADGSLTISGGAFSGPSINLSGAGTNTTTSNMIVRTGQGGTGISILSGHQITFASNSNERMRLDSNGNFVIGANTAGARLDVRAQGALLTDIAFRVRNSTDTADIIQVRGNGDVFIGIEAGKQTTAGGNTIIGNTAMKVNTSGYNNTSIGFSSLFQNTTGFANVAIGLQSLYSNTTGSNNTAVGLQSLYNLSSGNGNFAMGNSSGQLIASGAALTSSTNSLFIGRATRANANGETNQIVIGDSAVGIGSNSVVLGGSSITKTKLQGQVIIGSFASSPTGIEGAIYYDSTTKKHYGFDGTTWNALY